MLGIVAVASLLALSGCASTVRLHPSAGANTLACADLTVRLPTTLECFRERDTDAQATGGMGLARRGLRAVRRGVP